MGPSVRSMMRRRPVGAGSAYDGESGCDESPWGVDSGQTETLADVNQVDVAFKDATAKGQGEMSCGARVVTEKSSRSECAAA